MIDENKNTLWQKKKHPFLFKPPYTVALLA
jgi:hypothetical protein